MAAEVASERSGTLASNSPDRPFKKLRVRRATLLIDARCNSDSFTLIQGLQGKFAIVDERVHIWEKMKFLEDVVAGPWNYG